MNQHIIPSICLLMALLLVETLPAAEETLPPLVDGKAPQSVEELWSGFDPRQEPLETEILKEWEKDGVVLRAVRYRIGVFKGRKAMMAAVYGFPKGGAKLPGLVQIHGGGQSAHDNAVFTNAKRGYATISIAWAGRIDASGYRVGNDNVALFWAGKTADPGYRVTTDWGALDAYHAPCRNEKNGFHTVSPADWTLDAVESPRNNPWFLCTLGARRALTFLERQPEVDAARLGVYGHSMGGKITVLTTAVDARVKASAPSCGGLSSSSDNPLYQATLSDGVHLKRIACPIIFLSPANDFHGQIDDLPQALDAIASTDWRVTCSAHHNHQDTAEYQVAGPLWFDQHLKGAFIWPRTPATTVDLRAPGGIPTLTVKPDPSRRILAVDVFFTQQGRNADGTRDMTNTVNRFWHHADATRDGDAWSAALPLSRLDRPLWVYANVLYALDVPVTAAGYYYGDFTATTVNCSSRMAIIPPAQLQEAGVRVTDQPSLLIEAFADGWQKEWFTYDLTDHWARKTHKLYDGKWQAPPFAQLALEVRSEKPNRLVVGLDDFAAEIPLTGGPAWQNVVLFPTDFHDARGTSFLAWKGFKELRLGAKETLRSKVHGKDVKLDLGGEWQGPRPAFRNLRWEAGTKAELNARRTVKLAQAVPADGRIRLDIRYADAFTHGDRAVMDTTLDGKPLVVEGNIYAHGIATHAPSEAVFFLGGRYRSFHALAASGSQASVVFRVVVDDRTVFDSGMLSGGKWKTVDADCAGAQELRLVVDDGGNGKGGDAATWIDAYVQ